MKRYFQEAYRSGDGDVVIQQFTEFKHTSGLFIPRHISTVSIESQISTETMIDMMGHEFYYEPVEEMYDSAEEPNAQKIVRFSVEPYNSKVFCRLSADTIVEAFNALTFYNVAARVEFESVHQLEEVADDDRETLHAIAQLVYDKINGIDRRTPLPSGLYL